MDREETLQALDLNQQGIVLLKAGNASAAREQFQKAVEKDPMVMESYRNLGDLALQEGTYEEAKNYYRKALLIEKSGQVYFQYGNACFMNDEPHEGLKYYNQALSAGFDSDEMLFFMGLAYEHMNDDRMALRYIQKALQKNPSRPDYKVKKVSVLLRLNMLEEAGICVDEILEEDPELYEGYHMKILLLLNDQKYEEAASFARKASERFPDDVDLLFDYAKSTALAGDLDGALHLLGIAGKMQYFESVRAQFALLEAEITAEKGEIAGAIACCRKCIALEKEGECYVKARFLLINLSVMQEDYETALEQSGVLIDRDEKDSYYYAALYYRPLSLSRLGKSQEAEHFFREAVSLYRYATLKDPSAIEAYMYRAMCLKDLKEYDKALEMLDFMETLDSSIAEIYSIRADIYQQTGNSALAEEQLRKAMALRPELNLKLKPE